MGIRKLKITSILCSFSRLANTSPGTRRFPPRICHTPRTSLLRCSFVSLCSGCSDSLSGSASSSDTWNTHSMRISNITCIVQCGRTLRMCSTIAKGKGCHHLDNDHPAGWSSNRHHKWISYTFSMTIRTYLRHNRPNTATLLVSTS